MSDLDEIRRKRMAELEARQAAAQGQMYSYDDIKKMTE